MAGKLIQAGKMIEKPPRKSDQMSPISCYGVDHGCDSQKGKYSDSHIIYLVKISRMLQHKEAHVLGDYDLMN